MPVLRLDRATDILGVVDVQPTFMPHGELPVADGDAVVPVINRLMAKFDHAFATQDWHPAWHISFASSHPGRNPFDTAILPYGEQILWPDHAVQGTANAALHEGLELSRVEVIIRKGYHPNIDSYSAFFENDRKTATGLDGWLRQRGFHRICFVGLATDFCVSWSAEDAIRLGYETIIVEDACRAIVLPTGPNRTTMDDARARLTALGARFVSTSDIA
jgi:nicotinamidase/pyrazinamidase